MRTTLARLSSKNARNISLFLSTMALLGLSTHALYVHTMAGELKPSEIVLIEVLWVPILLLSKDLDKRQRRALVVLFASFSGYFLPRLLELLPWNVLEPLFVPDALFSNAFFKFLGVPVEIVVSPQYPQAFVKAEGLPIVAYLVGCSTLRSTPMLVALALSVPVPWKRRVAAAIIATALSYPMNALRVLSIVEFTRTFNVGLQASHILLSPVLTLTLVYLIMIIQDKVLEGKMIEYIEEGLYVLLDYVTKPLGVEISSKP